MSIEDSWRELEQEIERACRASGRDRADVTLVAVSKTFSAGDVREAHRIGLRDFGENRAQELRSKAAELEGLDLTWHLIGSLQTNKVQTVLPLLGLLHSLDRSALVEEIARRATRPVDALIQVKTTDEPSKSGAAIDEVAGLIDLAAQVPTIRLRGFMTIGPLDGEEAAVRGAFRALRGLRDREAARRPELDLSALSMGMSGDFAWAIEEGATHIRIGSRLFGNRARAM